MGKTKIVVTIGPATNSKQTIMELVEKGCDVIKINLNDFDYLQCDKILEYINEVNEELNTNVAVMLDINGENVKNGLIKDDYVQLKKDSIIRIYSEDILGDETKFCINYQNIINEIRIGNVIYLNNNSIGKI